MPHSRAVVLDGTSQSRIEIRDLETPELGPDGELALRTLLCGYLRLRLPPL